MNNESELNTTPQAQVTQSAELNPQADASLDSTIGQVPYVADATVPVVVHEARRRLPWRGAVGLVLLALGMAGALFVLSSISTETDQPETGASSQIKSQTLVLGELGQQLAAASDEPANRLTVNGQLIVTDSLVLQPTARPDNAVEGQLFYDQDNKGLTYYNGSQFINLLGTTSNTQQITNIINQIIGGGAGGVTDGITGSGTPGTIAMFTGENEIGDSLITQSGTSLQVGTSGTTSSVSLDASGTIEVGASAGNHTIRVGTGTGKQTVTVGSTSGSSVTDIHGGTDGINISTGAGSGETGSISIKTGNSSTTASGNVEIDAGSGFIDGEIVSHKDFESGLDNLTPWFGTTLEQTTEQARTGTHSLKETGTSPFEGIIENINNPITPATPGHQYFFSFWVRAATVPRTVNITVYWQGTALTVPMTPTMDSTSEWTQITGTSQAPAGSTGIYITTSHAGAVNEVHYFDDFTITDLSSGAAISAINIGATNAKVITIGNLNQIGATSLYGSSGINLNSGAASTTISAGAVSIAGSAASTFSTSGGALTLTSATAATWGIGTSQTGAGENLTLRAGNGAGGGNDGGDLVLQGGASNGIGTGGSVIIRPQNDSADAFLLQNSTSTTLLSADTTDSVITVSGTDTTFATLTLENAHFRSTQTTPPSIGTPTNCGTTPTAAMDTGATDSAGSFTITTGTGGTASTCDTTITFHQPYGAAPKSVIVVGKTDADSVARQVYASAATATTFTVSFAVSAGGADSTPYSFSYWVVE